MPKNEDPVAEFKRRAEAAGWGWGLTCDYMSTKPYCAFIYTTGEMACRGIGLTESEACQAALDRLDEAQGKEAGK